MVTWSNKSKGEICFRNRMERLHRFLMAGSSALIPPCLEDSQQRPRLSKLRKSRTFRLTATPRASIRLTPRSMRSFGYQPLLPNSSSSYTLHRNVLNSSRLMLVEHLNSSLLRFRSDKTMEERPGNEIIYVYVLYVRMRIEAKRCLSARFLFNTPWNR